eukprot:CAMPEP_0114518494 /NCGR_PEP_ID=MMETSP0109-20121206/18476_1 /TAXON_ID=29199 /ORGANISM="Chlorarachnion reptans, Strain CCCM449" /LENGTH=797 /DNA_ID=CAMNT_0001699123 /DNA_START=197 /DNA_END=2587 /DNA_ORIENTATION=+
MHISARRVRRLLRILDALSTKSEPKESKDTRNNGDVLIVIPEETDGINAGGDGKLPPGGQGAKDSEAKRKSDAEELEALRKETAEESKPDYRNTKYAITMEISSVNLLITNDLDPYNPIDIIAMRVGTIRMGFRQREYDMEASLGIKSISLEDRLQKHGEAFRFMISTNQDSQALRGLVANIEDSTNRKKTETSSNAFSDAENFIDISVRFIGPEAVDVYDYVNSEIKFKVGTLVLATNHETIPEMAYFFSYQLMPPSGDGDDDDDPGDELEALQPAAGVHNPSDGDGENGAEEQKGYLHQALDSYKDQHEKTSLNKEDSKREVFLTKVETSFESLQIMLCTRGRVLARAQVEDFAASFTDSDEHKRANLSLSGIWIRDLTNVSPLYPYMIECTKGKKLVDFNVHMRNKALYKASEASDMASSYLTTNQTPKIMLKGGISGIKVTFLNRFIQEMMGYPNAILAEMAKQTPPKDDEEEKYRMRTLIAPGHNRKALRSRIRSRLITPLITPRFGRSRNNSISQSKPASPADGGSNPDEKVEARIKQWKKEKGIHHEDTESKEEVFDFYKVDLQLHKIEVIVPEASQSRDAMSLTLQHIGINNCLCEEADIPQPEAGETKAVGGEASALSALSGSALSEEFHDCRELKPVVYTRWDVILNKLQAVCVFDNPGQGITRATPLPLFQIQEPDSGKGAEGVENIAARIVAVQTLAQNRLDPVLHPDLFVLMQVADINVIASPIQLKFLTRLASRNLAEGPVVMRAPGARGGRAASADESVRESEAEGDEKLSAPGGERREGKR